MKTLKSTLLIASSLLLLCGSAFADANSGQAQTDQSNAATDQQAQCEKDAFGNCIITAKCDKKDAFGNCEESNGDDERAGDAGMFDRH